MRYRLFLDDDRAPPNDGEEWLIARTFEEATYLVNQYGYPSFVSFDNDLGEGRIEGRDFAKWLVNHDQTFGGMPADFAWYAHTQNPVARDAINGLLSAYMAHKVAQ